MQNDTLLFINTNNFDLEVIKSALKGFEGVSGLNAVFFPISTIMLSMFHFTFLVPKEIDHIRVHFVLSWG